MKLISAIALAILMVFPASAEVLKLKTLVAVDASIKQGALLSQGSSFYTANNGFTRHRPTRYNSLQVDTFACTAATISKLKRDFNAVSVVVSARQRSFCFKPARIKAYASLLDKNSNIAIKTSNAIAYSQQAPVLFAGTITLPQTETVATLLFDGNTIISSSNGNSFVKANKLVPLPDGTYAKVDPLGTVSGPFKTEAPFLFINRQAGSGLWHVCSAIDNEVAVAGRSMQWCNIGKLGDEVIVTNPAGLAKKYRIVTSPYIFNIKFPTQFSM